MDFFPCTVFTAPWLAPLALLLDLLFGDPPLPWPHPVVLQGRFLSRLERFWRSLPDVFLPPILARIAGFLTLLLLSFLTAFLLCLLLSLPYVGPLLALYFAWAGLAMGSLIAIGNRILEDILEAPLLKARRSLSALVSRDTRFMDRECLKKTLADTLSENFTDALTAPFFWLLLFGPVGLWVYKGVSTGDSMWGYMTPKWRYLGNAFARGDDCLALIPARLSLVLIQLVDALLRLFSPKMRSWSGRIPGFFAVHKEALGMPSPNSGCSMAAFAWLMQGRMAGPSVYFGTLVEKPWLGPKDSLPWDRERLSSLLSAMRLCALFGMLILWAAVYLFCSIVFA